MTKLTELKIEEFAIDLFKEQGYKHIYAPDVAPNSDNPMGGLKIQMRQI